LTPRTETNLIFLLLNSFPYLNHIKGSSLAISLFIFPLDFFIRLRGSDVQEKYVSIPIFIFPEL